MVPWRPPWADAPDRRPAAEQPGNSAQRTGKCATLHGPHSAPVPCAATTCALGRLPAMKRTIATLCIASLAGACATPSYYTPVQVTRFTSAPAGSLPRGDVTVSAAPGADPADPLLAAYQRAVAEQLGMHGFTVANGPAPYTALVSVNRSVLPAGSRGGPVSVGGGASTGSYGSGVGLGLGINLSPKAPDRVDTQLSVSIRPTGGGDAIWEGRAGFAASINNQYANVDAAASKLSAALFQGFPR